MKNFVKAMAVVCSLALVACCFAGCGAGAKNYTSGNTTFVIGASGPLTGGAGVYGQGVKNGAGELVVNSIDTDGVKNGFDLELLDAVAARCAVPIIASGGAGKKEEFLELFRNHPAVDAGLAASIFHTKQVEINDLKRYLRENGVEMRV